ncbi:unnamed protein product [Phaeothamnion confervicola]
MTRADDEGGAAPMDVDGGAGADQDAVVREIDVFVSQSLRDKLYVLQYPLRAHENPPGPPASARCKPRAVILEVTHPIDTEGEHYDEDPPREHLKLESITHGSSRVPAATTYAVGVLRAGGSEFHLTPLHEVLQMRPNFAHVDEARRLELAGMGGDDADGGDAAATAGPAQQVGFKKRETERAAAARLNSYAYRRQREEAEAWVPLGVDDPEGAAYAFGRMGAADKARQLDFPGGPVDYLESLPHLRPRHGGTDGLGGDGSGIGGGGGGSGSDGGGCGGLVDLTGPDAADASGAGATGAGDGGVGGMGPRLMGADLVLACLKKARVIRFDMLREVCFWLFE